MDGLELESAPARFFSAALRAGFLSRDAGRIGFQRGVEILARLGDVPRMSSALEMGRLVVRFSVLDPKFRQSLSRVLRSVELAIERKRPLQFLCPLVQIARLHVRHAQMVVGGRIVRVVPHARLQMADR
jgi:hypothetical protein